MKNDIGEFIKGQVQLLKMIESLCNSKNECDLSRPAREEISNDPVLKLSVGVQCGKDISELKQTLWRHY